MIKKIVIGCDHLGRELKDNLKEILEINNHPWYLGCQFHPEFTSKPKTGHPLFNDFVSKAVELKEKK